MSNTEINIRFNSAWESFDVDAIMAFFAEDATFHMMPTRKATSHAEIRALIEAIIRPHRSASSARWKPGVSNETAHGP